MEDSIFHNGLEGELRDWTGEKLLRNIYHIVSTVVITHILELYVKPYMLQLLFHRVQKLLPPQESACKSVTEPELLL